MILSEFCDFWLPLASGKDQFREKVSSLGDGVKDQCQVRPRGAGDPKTDLGDKIKGKTTAKSGGSPIFLSK